MRLWSIAVTLLLAHSALVACTAPRSGLDRADVPGAFCQANLLIDLNNCGRCGNVCALENANATCRDGVCRVESCASNFSDCDNRPDNGCEVSLLTDSTHCGACDTQCAPANGSGTCTMGRCMVTGCSMGFGDCDSLQSTGCESNTQTSLTHCGACGRACAPNNATGRCMAGQCAVAECNAGFTDCDMSSENGCESNSLTDSNNCGTCGHRCSMGQQCIRGRCSGDVVQVSVFSRQSCLVAGDGTVSCSGATDTGALGAPGPTIATSTPIGVSGLTDALEISVGTDFGCARTASGDVGCWGRNLEGQLGSPTRQPSDNAFALATIGAPVQSISVGDASACALQTNGRVKCWGANDYFQLGFAPDGPRVAMPTFVDNTHLGIVTQIAVGFHHSCAISLVNSAVRCWGRNTDGQVGQPNSGPGAMLVVGQPLANPVLSGASYVAVGLQNTCAIVAADESLRCWGNNRYGQLANNGQSASTPQNIQGLTGVKSVGIGDSFVCALKRDGTVWCWGIGSTGQLASGSTASSSTPLQIAGISDAVSLAVGRASACVVRANNRVTCWGDDGFGQLSSGRTLFYSTPHVIAGIPGTVVSLSAGASQTCVRSQDMMGADLVHCWGRNGSGSIGDGTALPRAVPTLVPNVTGNVSSGAAHVCAGFPTTRCWGANGSGQLGNNTQIASALPVGVSLAAPTGATALHAGDESTCAVIAGALHCWGDNNFGQLGLGVVRPNALVPTAVVGGGGNVFDAVRTGPSHTCARRAVDSSLTCWGRAMFGELGDGTPANSANRLAPINSSIALPNQVASFDVGSSFTCARLVNTGPIYCWGLNDAGQLGNGQATNATVPTVISPNLNTAVLDVGARFACVVANAVGANPAGVYCWGSNYFRQLGADPAGGLTLSRTARLVAGVRPAVGAAARISVGESHACVLDEMGQVLCWGRNLENQIADGAPAVRHAPFDTWLNR